MTLGPIGLLEPVTPFPLNGRVTEGSEDTTIPHIREAVEVRSNGDSTTGYSLVVHLKITGKTLDVVDIGGPQGNQIWKLI